MSKPPLAHFPRERDTGTSAGLHRAGRAADLIHIAGGPERLTHPENG
jgi:hypothetical protein